MKNLRVIPTLPLLLSLAVFACSKEKEEPVEAEQATAINQGNGIIETIQRQPNGTTVVFSNWIQKTPADWSQFGTTVTATDILTTSLTEDIKNNGLVLVYFNYANFIGPLPTHDLGENLVLSYSFLPGIITARYVYHGGSTVGDIYNIRFRYILIPSSSFAGPVGGRMAAPIDYKDYNAVCEFYGIPK
jgi:hypothetical protein